MGLASALGFDPSHRPMRDAAELKAALHAEIAASGCSDVVLSAEYFMLVRDIAPVAEFLSRYDTRVVVFLRRHEAWLELLVKQALLTVEDLPWDMTVRGYLEHQDRRRGQYIDYTDLLNDWSAHIGKENIIVRPYERHAEAPDLGTEFLQAIKREDAAQRLGPTPIVNGSLPSDALVLIRQLRRSPLPHSLRAALVHIVERGARGTHGGAKMSPDIRAEIRRRFEPQYAQIARDYLGRPDGILFKTAEQDSDEPARPAKVFSALRNSGFIARGVAKTAWDAGSIARKGLR